MPKYIALLRGINVSGQKKIKMADLRAHLSDLKLGDVQTYIQSGNITFESPAAPDGHLAAAIKGKILEAYGFEVPTLVVSSEELQHVAVGNPFPQAAAADNVGIIVRVPLASGLLTGKFSKSSTFGAGDHRHGNRNGEWFDKGETFAGIPFETGLEAVDKIEGFLPAGYPLTHAALQWILSRPEVSTIIPGASRAEQVDSNLAAAEAAPLSDDVLKKIQGLYEADIKPLVHQLW